eukprot:TRINITY_DN6492_c0_g2_i1.p1 TRINITY_DN6492_c0_g2~~TRINITY_DN6492_c0_g2_i1.p1  ORF type:complete len:416 (-),score=96.66 TRINITY_DN6492_c0_g2_i1:56-1270(-)
MSMPLGSGDERLSLVIAQLQELTRHVRDLAARVDDQDSRRQVAFDASAVHKVGEDLEKRFQKEMASLREDVNTSQSKLAKDVASLREETNDSLSGLGDLVTKVAEGVSNAIRRREERTNAEFDRIREQMEDALKANNKALLDKMEVRAAKKTVARKGGADEDYRDNQIAASMQADWSNRMNEIFSGSNPTRSETQASAAADVPQEANDWRAQERLPLSGNAFDPNHRSAMHFNRSVQNIAASVHQALGEIDQSAQSGPEGTSSPSNMLASALRKAERAEDIYRQHRPSNPSNLNFASQRPVAASAAVRGDLSPRGPVAANYLSTPASRDLSPSLRTRGIRDASNRVNLAGRTAGFAWETTASSPTRAPAQLVTQGNTTVTATSTSAPRFPPAADQQFPNGRYLV